MYFKRKVDSYLRQWKEKENRLPLIIKGARQIGKTESIIHFADENYENVVSINFVLEGQYKTILSDGYSVENIIKNISLIDPSKKFIAGKTLIVFDELQEFPDISTSLKSFKMDGRFDVICSGSLLGINYKKIHSNSVGYKTDYEMFSMDFEEFLWAKGYSDLHIEQILEHMCSGKVFSETELSVYKKLFLEYCVLGGMPAVIRQYIETNTFSDTLEIQRQIQLDYEEDIRKYAEGLDQTKIASVYRSVPVQLAKENKKFQLSKIEKNARSREYSGCIDWLKDAGVVSVCYCLDYPELPLKGNYDELKFKLYYHKKENATLEEDFFVRTKDELVPVEVKANNNRSKSLRKLIDNENYSDIKWGIKLADSNVGIENGIYTFPYFCSFLIKRYLAKRG